MIKIRCNQKAQADIRIIAFIFVIIFLILFISFYSTNNDINLGVSLVDADIEEGTDAILHYEIKNGWFSGQKNDVKIIYNIKGITDEKTIPIGDMENGKTVDNSLYLDTKDLNDGKYNIWTVLEYKINGIVHTKELGLVLTIY